MSFNELMVETAPKQEQEQEYLSRLSLEAVEALATAASIHRWREEKKEYRSPRSSIHEDPLSLEAAEVLTEVMALHRVSVERQGSPDSDSPPPPPPAYGDSPSTLGDSPSNSFRGRYRCGRCGQLKVNHACPLAKSPLQRSMSIQTAPIVVKDNNIVAANADADVPVSKLVARPWPPAPTDKVIAVRRPAAGTPNKKRHILVESATGFE